MEYQVHFLPLDNGTKTGAFDSRGIYIAMWHDGRWYAAGWMRNKSYLAALHNE